MIRECSARLFDFLVASDEENEHDADDDALNNVDGGVENVGFHLKPPVDIPEKRLGAVCIFQLDAEQAAVPRFPADALDERFRNNVVDEIADKPFGDIGLRV